MYIVSLVKGSFSSHNLRFLFILSILAIVNNNVVVTKLIVEIWEHSDLNAKKSEEARNTNQEDFKQKRIENDDPKVNAMLLNVSSCYSEYKVILNNGNDGQRDKNKNNAVIIQNCFIIASFLTAHCEMCRNVPVNHVWLHVFNSAL